MKNRRVSGRKLSELTGISRSAISQIVNGRLLPNDELEKICTVLEVKPDQVYPIQEMREVLQMTPEEEEKAYERLGMLKLIADERLDERERRVRLDAARAHESEDKGEIPAGEPEA